MHIDLPGNNSALSVEWSYITNMYTNLPEINVTAGVLLEQVRPEAVIIIVYVCTYHKHFELFT